jgi:membrane-anchored mycosin MYCP
MPDLPMANFPDVPTDDGVTVAVIDTGVMRHHPLIEPRLRRDFDLTGEGPEDIDGHGTAVAIIAILQAPMLQLLNLKVWAKGASFEEDVRRLADGIHIAVEQGARILNLAVGDARPCGPSHEPMCVAVRDALDAGCEVVVAGEARCPAGCDERVIVVSEIDPVTGEAIAGAAPTISAPSPGTTKFVLWSEWLARLTEPGRGG